MDPQENTQLVETPEEEWFLQWVAPTHTHTHRSNDWYWALGLLAICSIIACILWGNLLFAAIITLSALCILVVAARTPREHDVVLMRNGIILDQEFFPYQSLRSFWIADHIEEAPRLILSTEALIHPHLVIPITQEVEKEHVRAYLEQYIPEEPGHSPATFFVEFLGF